MESGDDADRRRPDESSDDDGDESGVPAWSWDGINCGLLDCSKHGDGSIYRAPNFGTDSITSPIPERVRLPSSASLPLMLSRICLSPHVQVSSFVKFNNFISILQLYP